MLFRSVSATVFIMEGAVVWRYAPVMIVSAVAGGYVGARLARKLPQHVVRGIVIAIGLGVAGYSFYKNLTRQ